MGKYVPTKVENKYYAGIYFLCMQTNNRQTFFRNLQNQDWLIEKKYDERTPLTIATDNDNRNGYFIYRSSNKIVLGN